MELVFITESLKDVAAKEKRAGLASALFFWSITWYKNISRFKLGQPKPLALHNLCGLH